MRPARDWQDRNIKQQQERTAQIEAESALEAKLRQHANLVWFETQSTILFRPDAIVAAKISEFAARERGRD